MKSLTIVTTWGTKYWPKPVQAGIQSTVKNWPGHAKILLYPDDMSQQIQLPRTTYYDLSIEQPALKEFIDECFDEEGKHNEQHNYKKIVSTKNCKYCDFRDKPELCDRKPN